MNTAMTPDEITARLRAALAETGQAEAAHAANGSAGTSAEAGRAAALDAEISPDMVTVTVPPQGWVAALACARDDLDCDFFDWLTGVDELDAGVAVLTHVYSLAGRHHLVLRTLLPGEPRLATATGIYRGAAWHERETHEMFGVMFEGHPGLDPLLLPDGFGEVPLRKNFVLTARRDRDWPGAKEPGEQAGARARRRPPAPAIHDGWPAS
ncbi:MAG: NADH-quinone oxidoreductase subunit [Streptosporangiaceae bacterium]|jgi:NADH-quinone oxidoreductase subunit C|nr:NADH-quinone oxidoreductase subunit [Streptosporangiaceae bacterium]